jgi:tetratricopeptide (TPR) repeat protein
MGIACLNARRLELAVEHLSKADKLRPNQDHVRYALAASHALLGTIDEALAHLEVALALRPENRIYARRDEDFLGLADDPRFRQLVNPAGTQAARSFLP